MCAAGGDGAGTSTPWFTRMFNKINSKKEATGATDNKDKNNGGSDDGVLPGSAPDGDGSGDGSGAGPSGPSRVMRKPPPLPPLRGGSVPGGGSVGSDGDVPVEELISPTTGPGAAGASGPGGVEGVGGVLPAAKVSDAKSKLLPKRAAGLPPINPRAMSALPTLSESFK